jgi:hypothetical protein
MASDLAVIIEQIKQKERQGSETQQGSDRDRNK